MVQEVVNLAFVGQLNDAAMLAGVGLGNTILNMCGMSIILGLNLALETFVSQSFGQGNLQLCGLYLNRGRFILTILFIPLCMVFSQTGFILECLGQDPQVAYYAHLYVNTYLPGIYLLGQFDMLRKFLNCLRKNTVPLKAIAIG